VGKEFVVLLSGVLLRWLVLVGDRPMLPVFMGKGLQLVGLHVMLFMLQPRELRLPGQARAHLLLMVQVLVGTIM
jgi:hypothetical protein